MKILIFSFSSLISPLSARCQSGCGTLTVSRISSKKRNFMFSPSQKLFFSCCFRDYGNSGIIKQHRYQAFVPLKTQSFDMHAPHGALELKRKFSFSRKFCEYQFSILAILNSCEKIKKITKVDF